MAAAQNNVFALMDSVTAKIHAIVVDANNPPGLLSANNAYWRTAITTQAGNPLVAVPIAPAVYNALDAAGLVSTLTTLFNTLGTPVSLG